VIVSEFLLQKTVSLLTATAEALADGSSAVLKEAELFTFSL
jgi:hypothetical protein